MGRQSIEFQIDYFQYLLRNEKVLDIELNKVDTLDQAPAENCAL